jgi:hypothetical protein
MDFVLAVCLCVVVALLAQRLWGGKSGTEKPPSLQWSEERLEAVRKSHREMAARDVRYLGPSRCIADIEFDYLDATGAPSRRRVLVDAIDDGYFEGFCKSRRAMRTFVVGRIRSKVLDLQTGELLTPKNGLQRPSCIPLTRTWLQAEVTKRTRSSMTMIESLQVHKNLVYSSLNR